MSDQDNISPYNIITILNRQVMSRKIKISIWELQVDPKPNSQNEHYSNYVAECKENYYLEHGSIGLILVQ